MTNSDALEHWSGEAGDHWARHGVLDQSRALLPDEHGIAHATLQIEPDTHEGCDDVAW
jgi:hypothetical protein